MSHLDDLSTCLACGGPLRVVNWVVRNQGTERLAVLACMSDAHHQYEHVTHLRKLNSRMRYQSGEDADRLVAAMAANTAAQDQRRAG